MRHGVVDDALAVASRQRQRRSTLPLIGARSWPPERPLGGFGAASLVIAMIALVIASVALLASGALPAPVTPPGQPSIGLGVAPEPSAPVTAVPVSDDLRGTWLAMQPSAMTLDGRTGPATMRLVFEAAAIRVEAPTVRDGALFTGTTAAADHSTLVLETGGVPADPPVEEGGAPVAACRAGDTGRYSVHVSTDQSAVPAADPDVLVLALQHDACAARADILSRTWVRSLLGRSRGGTGILPVSSYLLAIALPPGGYTSAGTDSGWDVRSDDNLTGIRAYVDPRAVLDPCRPLEGTTDAAETVDEFVAAVRSTSGVRLVDRSNVAVAGRPATMLVLVGPASDACGAVGPVGWQTGTLWPLAPRTVLYLIEARPHLLILEPRSPDVAIRQSILELIEFADLQE